MLRHKSLKVLLLSRFVDRAASRFRCFQFIPYLERSGIVVTPAPFFGEYYLQSLYACSKIPRGRVLLDYCRRIVASFEVSKFDLIWLQYEVFPWLPLVAERLLLRKQIPYLVDYDDAWFHRYDEHPNVAVRWLLGDKIDRLMRQAAIVVAGNSYTAEHAMVAGAKRVECMATPVDLDLFPLDPPKQGTVFTVGWLGSPSTARYLHDEAFVGALRSFCHETGAHLVFVGAGPVLLPALPFESKIWTRETEVSEVKAFDVGLAPMGDGPFERGKCGFKIVQYMACQLPVVASDVGYHRELVRHGETGFLVTSEHEWLDALRRLHASRTLRHEMGMAGRRLIEESYSVRSCAPKLAALLRAAAEP